MFGSIIDLTSSDLTLKLIVLCTMTSILAGFAISYIYICIQVSTPKILVLL